MVKFCRRPSARPAAGRRRHERVHTTELAASSPKGLFSKPPRRPYLYARFPRGLALRREPRAFIIYDYIVSSSAQRCTRDWSRTTVMVGIHYVYTFYRVFRVKSARRLVAGKYYIFILHIDAKIIL